MVVTNYSGADKPAGKAGFSVSNNNLLSEKNKELKVNIDGLEKAFSLSLKKTETEKLNAISDNKSLARRIKTMSSETGEEGAKLNLIL
jgi:hypothetical protein